MLRCPNCKEVLIRKDNSYTCLNNHHFDCAKSGYVNLLQGNAKQHGDDLKMLKSRQAFLDKGYYTPLSDRLKEIINTINPPTILDAGCGEGWYCEQIQGNIIGVDISKDGCNLSAKRNKSMIFAVGSTFDLPIMDQSIDLVYSIFAPFDHAELHRVLKENGCFIHVFPLVDHLLGLKQAVYDEAYVNDIISDELNGFITDSYCEVKDMIHLNDHESIMNLFAMTPYVHRTKTSELNRLDTLNEVITQIEFGIRVFKKKTIV